MVSWQRKRWLMRRKGVLNNLTFTYWSDIKNEWDAYENSHIQTRKINQKRFHYYRVFGFHLMRTGINVDWDRWSWGA